MVTQLGKPEDTPVAAVTAKQASPQRDLADGLYTGQINVAFNRLEEELYFEVAVRVFNATGLAVTISKVIGYLECRDPRDGPHMMEPRLSLPQWMHEVTKNIAQDLTEFMIVLHQRVPRETASRILAAIDDKSGLRINFDKLDILVVELEKEKATRLPVWGEITVHRSQHVVNVGRVIHATARASIG